MEIERVWWPAHGVRTRRAILGSLADLGLCAPPAIYDDDPESLLAARAWVALYIERRTAFDAWVERELKLAAAAVESVRGQILGNEAFAAFAARGEFHVWLFGWDGRNHKIDSIELDVSEGVHAVRGGAIVIVTIDETFGGGDRWFGPPGHRTYQIDIPVEGRSPWTTPDPDPGLDAMLARVAERRDAAWHRHAAARSRVAACVAAIYNDGALDRGPSSPRAKRAARIAEELYGQVQEIDPLRHASPEAHERRWTDPCQPFDGHRGWGMSPPAPLDIWPGRGARPRRHLGRADVSRGWYAQTKTLRQTLARAA